MFIPDFPRDAHYALLKVANEDSASHLLLQPGTPVNVWTDGRSRSDELYGGLCVTFFYRHLSQKAETTY